MIVPVRVEMWGRGERFGYAPLPDGTTYAFASVDAPEGAMGERAEDLRRRFADWPDPVPRLLAAMDPGEVLHDDLYDLPPLRTYVSGCPCCSAMRHTR